MAVIDFELAKSVVLVLPVVRVCVVVLCWLLWRSVLAVTSRLLFTQSTRDCLILSLTCGLAIAVSRVVQVSLLLVLCSCYLGGGDFVLPRVNVLAGAVPQMFCTPYPFGRVLGLSICPDPDSMSTVGWDLFGW